MRLPPKLDLLNRYDVTVVVWQRVPSSVGLPRARPSRRKYDEAGIKCGVNGPGFPEAVSFELRGYGWFIQHGVVAFLGFGRRDVADGLQQPAIVEAVDPFERGELDGLE